MAGTTRTRKPSAPKKLPVEATDLEQAQRLVEQANIERQKRVEAFGKELEALCAKYDVRLDVSPPQIVAVAQ